MIRVPTLNKQSSQCQCVSVHTLDELNDGVLAFKPLEVLEKFGDSVVVLKFFGDGVGSAAASLVQGFDRSCTQYSTGRRLHVVKIHYVGGNHSVLLGLAQQAGHEIASFASVAMEKNPVGDILALALLPAFGATLWTGWVTCA